MKTALILAAFITLPFATATAFVNEPDSLPIKIEGTEPSILEIPTVDRLFLDNPELLDNTLYFHVYDKNDKELMSRDHSRETLITDMKLLAILKNCKLLVKADNHYFFYTND